MTFSRTAKDYFEEIWDLEVHEGGKGSHSAWDTEVWRQPAEGANPPPFCSIPPTRSPGSKRMRWQCQMPATWTHSPVATLSCTRWGWDADPSPVPCFNSATSSTGLQGQCSHNLIIDQWLCHQPPSSLPLWHSSIQSSPLFAHDQKLQNICKELLC